ncbi:MAG: hypothetical protein KGJ89_01485 [Patescibacteria group bacterium]|nr:hypothetical protein [Patescibacteria group bacterium]MDE2015185.1 hypothetical protein [Patescibacteria group bacterium]MDE2226613.1 hypothetical protein [Patescibacteria group bacterium]
MNKEVPGEKVNNLSQKELQEVLDKNKAELLAKAKEVSKSERLGSELDTQAEDFKTESLKRQKIDDILDRHLREDRLPEAEDETIDPEEIKKYRRRVDQVRMSLAVMKQKIKKKGIADIDVSGLEDKVEKIYRIFNELEAMSPQEKREYLSIRSNRTSMSNHIVSLEQDMATYKNLINNT